MTGKNTLALNPFFYTSTVDGFRTTGSDLLIAYGITDQLDFWYDIGVIDTNGSHFISAWSTMVRYDVYKGNILAFKTSSSAASLQYHVTLENNLFGFQFNGVVQSLFKDKENLSAWSVVCPLFKFATGCDVFCEVNPGYYAQDNEFINYWVRPKGFGLDVVPGIGFMIRDAIFSVAVPVYDITNKPTATLGAWIFFSLTK
jgi:hypothetical protein